MTKEGVDMDIDDYVRIRIQDSIDNGVTHLEKEFNEKYEDFSCITIESLVDWNNDIHCNMQRAESYSIEHGYWWSLHGHLTDIIKHAKLL